MLTPANIHDGFRFRLSVSVDCYDTKPESNSIKAMHWKRQSLDVATFAEYIGCGRTFFPLSRSKKLSAHLKTNVLFIDIDHAWIPFAECLKRLPYKPTIAYRSYSDNEIGEDYRYRLVYVFDEPYTGLQLNYMFNYMKVELGLLSIVGDKTPDNRKIVDDRVANQYYNGTDKEVVTYGTVYKLPDGIESENYDDYINGAKDVSLVSWRGKKDLFGEDVAEWYSDLSMGEFVDTMYRHEGLKLPIESEYERCDDERILVKPETYYRLPIRKRWNNETKHNEVVKWKDGELRHCKLFLAGTILRRMGDYTPAQLLYMMVCYALRYIDNTDGKFCKQEILDICCNCMDASLDNALTEVKASAYHVDAGYAYRTRQSKRQIVGQLNGERMAKEREERYVKIDKWYDAALTDKQNLANLKKHRVNVSARTLTNYKKNRGISKKRL